MSKPKKKKGKTPARRKSPSAAVMTRAIGALVKSPTGARKSAGKPWSSGVPAAPKKPRSKSVDTPKTARTAGS